MSAATDRASFEIIEDALSGRYRILAFTGGRGLSSLYEAEDVTLRRKVSIKCVFLDASAGSEALEMQKTRFYREAEVTAQLIHPAIVPIFDVITKPASAFVVMLHIEGDRLHTVLEAKKRLGLAECIDLFSHVANCLDYIHRNGVIHRNVKPANIIVRRPAGVALADFSLAQTRTASRFTLPARVSGTPTFMSPEQARGETLDGRSDLFSLGCILFLCLAGVKPFQGESASDTMKLVVGPDRPRPVDWEQLGVPAALDAVFEKALAKNVDERFGSGADLMKALSAVAAECESASATVVLAPAAAELPQSLDPVKLRMIREENRALELSPNISDLLQGVALSSEEGFVLSRIDGTSAPRDILAVSPLDEEDTARALLGMLKKEVIRLGEAGAKPTPARTTRDEEKASGGVNGEVKKESPADQALREEVETLIAAAKDNPARVLGADEKAEAHRGAQPVAVASERPASASPVSKTAVVDEADAFDKEKHAQKLFRHAEGASVLQDHWQAIQLCRQAIELYDKDGRFHHLLGLALLQNKKWRKEAAECLKTAAELEGNNPLYLGTLAAFYQAEGLQLRADKILAQLMKVDPSYELPELPA